MRKHYGVPTLPMMETGATDMAQLRSKGLQCYGVTPATDCNRPSTNCGAVQLTPKATALGE